MALQKMSPDMADLMKEAMGLQLDETGNDVISNKSTLQTTVTRVNIPGSGLESIQERLQGRIVVTSAHQDYSIK